MTAHSPDFDTVLAHGASHRYAGGESAVIRVVTGATLTLTSGHVTFDYPLEPRGSYMCPLKRGVLPRTPPVPPGRYPVHLIVADITDAGGGPDVISKVAAVRLVVRDEPAVAWDIHEDYPDNLNAQTGLENIRGLTDCQMCGTFEISELHEAFSWIRDGASSETVSNGNPDLDLSHLTDMGLPPWSIGDAMVMFPTGWAYGFYRTWAGRGADGGLVCLLTDFEVLSENLGPKPAAPALRPEARRARQPVLTASAPPPVPAVSAMDIRFGEAGHLSSPGTEMVEPFGGGTGFRFKIRNVKIDGQGDTVRVRGGGSHQLSFDLLHDCRECGAAINQVIVGLAGEDRAQASVWNGMQRSGGGLQAEWVNVSCTVVVPGQPGSYFVRARYAQAYHGRLMTAEGRTIPQPEYQDALDWWKVDRPDGPGPESTIGTITVES